MRTHARTHTHAHACPPHTHHIHAQSHSRTVAHTHTHTQTHTDTHTHTHTRTALDSITHSPTHPPRRSSKYFTVNMSHLPGRDTAGDADLEYGIVKVDEDAELGEGQGGGPHELALGGQGSLPRRSYRGNADPSQGLEGITRSLGDKVGRCRIRACLASNPERRVRASRWYS